MQLKILHLITQKIIIHFVDLIIDLIF